ncbi:MULTISPECIES: acyl carrier protein [unclassified Bradyrhizobium]|uniref:acyl carrier protein n=1 Tax=unclassified Bradyrhizobium TaxID=2631580 RepID=UPI001E30B941|nr:MULTISPECIES: acyl carrier protein [Bradyrhizobium]UFW40205.1 acyl carrier protein [Bradyrhizobium canariense]
MRGSGTGRRKEATVHNLQRSGDPAKLTTGGSPVLSFPLFLGHDMTREQISDFCVNALANILRISRDRVDLGTKFSRLGLDSAMLVYLMMELEEKLDLELSTDDFYDHPTVEALSRFLADKRAIRPAA